jgi:putative SOS response-associated peptidase YedK
MEKTDLIIAQKDEYTWLYATNKDDVISLMKPYDGELGSHQVVRVTNPTLTNTNLPHI